MFFELILGVDISIIPQITHDGINLHFEKATKVIH